MNKYRHRAFKKELTIDAVIKHKLYFEAYPRLGKIEKMESEVNTLLGIVSTLARLLDSKQQDALALALGYERSEK